MIQEFLVGLCFLAALYYLARTLVLPSGKKTGCSGGCQQCQTIDFEQIAQKVAREQPSIAGPKDKR